VGAFDWLKRKPPAPLAWHVSRDGSDLIVDDGAGHSFRTSLARARAVRVVPLTGGNPHGGLGLGYQVAIACTDGDAAIGQPTPDWRAARSLAEQICQTGELPLDELTQKLFSRVGTFSPKVDA